MIKYYNIKKANKDFIFIPEINNKGSRTKKTVIDIKTKEKAIFKYQKYQCSEACSEKLCYEIAKVLQYECARIEFAVDEKNNLGILNYLFVDLKTTEHTDAVAYINKNEKEISEFHTIENIKKCLDKLDQKLFFDFIKIMVFDALVGEQDRHGENWGIISSNGKYKISPLYDNSCNLLREFYDEKMAEKYYSGQKDFDNYIRKSRTLIFNENGKKYKHFELIEKLYTVFPETVEKEIINLKKLEDETINNIVKKVPINVISDKQKQYIIKYLKERRDILLEIIEKRK